MNGLIWFLPGIDTRLDTRIAWCEFLQILNDKVPKKFYDDSIDHNRGLLIPNSELFSKKLMKCILFWNLIWQIQDCGGKMCVYSLMLDLL